MAAVAPQFWFFDCHFPDDLGLDAMWRIIGYWFGRPGSPNERQKNASLQL